MISAIWIAQNYGFVTWRNIIIGSSMFSLITWFIYLLPYVIGRYIFYLLLFISAICFGIDLFCFYHFKTAANLNIFFTAIETTQNESFEFLQTYLEWKIVIVYIVFLLLSLGYFYFVKIQSNKKIWFVFLSFTLLDIAGIQIDGFDSARSIINENFNASRKRIVGGGVDYDKELKSQKSLY